MATYRGNAYLKHSELTFSGINHSEITSSSIDMDNQPIKNVKTPVEPADAATKEYVDSLGVRFNEVVLEGTEKTTVSSVLRGSFLITVTNAIPGGPTAIFNVTKNNSGVAASVTRTAMTPGSDNVTGLDMTWPPSQGIQLYKTTESYNGNYITKIF